MLNTTVHLLLINRIGMAMKNMQVMIPEMTLLVLFSLILLMLVPLQANAAAFKVNPLKLSFSPDTKTTSLEVSNTSGGTLTLQVDVKRWSQDSIGRDMLDDTNEILFFPKIVTLKVDEKRVIRVNYRGEKVNAKEKTFRIFVQELVDRSRDKNALNFALRFSIPIFVTPRNASARVRISHVETSGDKVSLVVENSGGTYSLIKKIQLTGLDDRQREVFFREEKGWYVLAGSSNVFEMSLAKSECQKASTMEFAARSVLKTYVTRLKKNDIHCP
ncbi:MAG: fimbria/pilus periplasmic chaperone [Gammaproteobacteria bacterium]|nr:fimbria/pilus periplasmic chaperone [Gammaproteobacteria bacterium]